MFSNKKPGPAPSNVLAVSPQPFDAVKSKPRSAGIPSIISSDMTIRGDLKSSGDLQIEGQVIGDIKVAKLVISESAMVSGDVTAKDVRICGALNGTVRAHMVTLTATARVMGDIHHELLAIETGGRLEGLSRRLTTEEDSAKAEPVIDLLPEHATHHN